MPTVGIRVRICITRQKPNENPENVILAWRLVDGPLIVGVGSYAAVCLSIVNSVPKKYGLVAGSWQTQQTNE
jgi:hypothetical protein